MSPRSGIAFALIAAALFGASTPLAKILLGQMEPLLLAGLLYLGSGSGLVLWSLVQRGAQREATLQPRDWPWLGGAILAGGVVAPALLMLGLVLTPASSAALLLNLEGVFTALMAWFIFKENFDRRIAWGMAAITAGGALLAWTGEFSISWGALAIGGACLGWAIDNNLTRPIAGGDPVQIAAVKGCVAGVVNSTLALSLGATLPGPSTLVLAGLVGLVGYGVSLTCFVLALRYIGTARTGAYFALAPFVGATLALGLLGEPVTPRFLGAALLMGVGAWLHLTENHHHEHTHETLEHVHAHTHDEHHQHDHSPTHSPGTPHSHVHRHQPLVHSHPHYPDLHHRHDHEHSSPNP
ncbi:DMT family transporter [Anthocerotibacter panamensis]|uniref:DMT family transporter n=1 Tax=Anthocerotibacter panamensis TaxID=2857077 RepID=UPI001C408C0D|nr:DMT family transporter [Anthocerotibacter panamensis]